MNPCTYSQCKTSTLRHPFTRFFTLEMEGVYENALCKSCVAEKGKINVQPIRNRVRTCFNHLKNCASFQCNFPSEYELIKSFSQKISPPQAWFTLWTKLYRTWKTAKTSTKTSR
eukprot:Sdes_comp18161_c0_seq1m7653